MENASKALIMAASILIAIIIIGALILMYNQIANYSSGDVQNTREQQVIAFNNEYERFNTKNVRGTDMISVMNKILDYNERKSDPQEIQFKEMHIKISINDVSDLKWGDTSLLIQATDYTEENIGDIMHNRNRKWWN